MKFYTSVCGKGIIYGALGVSGLLTGLSPNVARAAEPLSSAQPSMKELKSWRSSIMHTPRPKSGCFSAEYPKIEWREVPCTKAPVRPYRPSRGQRAFTVGNGNDVSAEVSSGHISEAIGSFDRITGVVNEYGIDPDTGGLAANIFSLQLNSNFFANTPACNGVTNCEGWAQFVYSNTAGMAFIQYWLIGYGATCPASGGPAGTGWISDGNHDCYGNSNAVTVTGNPPLNISELAQMSVTGQAASGGNDTLTMYVNGTAYSTSALDSVVSLANYWQIAEFNIFGDGNGSEAKFNYGSADVAALKVRTAVDYGSTSAPSCLAAGYTAETNNLYFGGYSTSASGTNPAAVVFTQSSTNSGYAACQSAASTGDTHLTTFSGLQYDFQATGDFVLTEAGSDFIVQTRQGTPVIDPRWKNTTINKAVAVQMGKTLVAVYVGPTRLVIDGKPYTMRDGQKHLVVNGVQIAHKDNEYVITSPKGDSVRAMLYDNGMNKWLNVSVSLSNSMRQARGLLGNLEGNTDELVTAHGTALKWPVSFHDLYNTYGESWRVQPEQMLLDADPTVKPGVPEKPFYVGDLKPKEATRAIEICKASGVSEPALLEACALDAAVLGDGEVVVQTYVHAVVPRAVMSRPILAPKQRG